MKNEIEKLNNYFVVKVLQGDYELKKIDHFTATIMIDGEYLFELWIAGEAGNFGCYSHAFNFMSLMFMIPEKEVLLPIFLNKLKDEENTPEKVAKRKAEYEKLKAEFQPSHVLIMENETKLIEETFSSEKCSKCK